MVNSTSYRPWDGEIVTFISALSQKITINN